MTLGRLVVAIILVLAVPGAPNHSGEAAPASAPPKAGEWYEYVVAYPLDPMETAIREIIDRSKPIITGTSGSAVAMTKSTAEGVLVDTQPANETEPVFDPEPVWFAMPLRLEILRVDPNGCQVMLTYAGRRDEVFLPLARNGSSSENESDAAAAGPTVVGDNPKEEEELVKDLDYMFSRESFVGEIEQTGQLERHSGRHWVGDHGIEVMLEQNPDPDLGFTRLVSPEAPFGLARFATPYVDFSLVDRGFGIAPEFPVPDALIDPPPGKLHPSRH